MGEPVHATRPDFGAVPRSRRRLRKLVVASVITAVGPVVLAGQAWAYGCACG